MNMDVLIDRYLESYRHEIVDAVCRLIQVPSVCAQSTLDYPYGMDCARALDFCMNLADRKGLLVYNYDYHCARADLPTEHAGRQILFAAHADVVPPDIRGRFPPFSGTVQGDYIIGRGAVDNKAPLIAALYALAFFRQYNISLKNRLSLLIGSDGESGMRDMDYYLTRAGQPNLAIIPLSGFPVVKGEPGLLRFSVSGPLSPDITALRCQKQPQCLYPESCSIVFHPKGEAPQELRFERAERNPIACALRACYQRRIPLFGPEQDMELLVLVNNACPFRMMEEFQEEVDIIPTQLQMEEGRRGKMSFQLYFSKDLERVRKQIQKIFQRSNLHLEIEHASPPCLLRDSDPVIRTLTDLCSRESGIRYSPCVMRRGTTYARKFSYACGFGAGCPAEKKPFPPGYGGSHGPDEAHSIRTLLHAVRLYIKAIWELDTCDWDGMRGV